MRDEFDRALKKLKEKRSPGIDGILADGIPAEIIKIQEKNLGGKEMLIFKSLGYATPYNIKRGTWANKPKYEMTVKGLGGDREGIL
ncbi:hypothetical protein J437_LFUL006382, partial [Ladona fulva]